MIRCEVTKDIPADDELVAMLTVSESAAGVSSSPSVVMDADASSAAPAAALSPVVTPRSPASRVDDGGAETVEGRPENSSTRPIITAPTENVDCRPCPAPISSHHKVANNSRKKDRTINHPNLASSVASLSDVDQQRRSFCK